MKMLMCHKATRLMSKRLDVPLTRKERLALTLHLAMCGACKNCNRQLTLIHTAGHEYEEQAWPTDPQTPAR
ncbi:zf-HC2 domain-containing protein [Halomonas sabkhae]|uniref:zf-HC2 domain-containing protein n=1 Tax=Halomonas sabkhae TaxID=626223 RepID=UPI0025B4E9E0|nr:zf-HC2 domain-containing protein [Halomonas sabkhae]MDN3524914.1 zf-HC2 domain-containing protein [Halomonas sabkhae]